MRFCLAFHKYKSLAKQKTRIDDVDFRIKMLQLNFLTYLAFDMFQNLTLLPDVWKIIKI